MVNNSKRPVRGPPPARGTNGPVRGTADPSVTRTEALLIVENAFAQEPVNAPFLNGLFSSGFSRGETAPQDEIGETPH